MKFFGQDVRIITHLTSINANPNENATLPLALSGNAKWQTSFDTSKVWAKAVGTVIAGTDAASCPNTGAIPCRLLQSIGNQEGQRAVNSWPTPPASTNGGSAPTTACSVGQTRLVPYTADYFFHGTNKHVTDWQPQTFVTLEITKTLESSVVRDGIVLNQRSLQPMNNPVNLAEGQRRRTS